MSDSERQLLIDEQLPTAQTCFFDLYLPAYSNEVIMRKRLLTVINLESWDVGNASHTTAADGGSRGNNRGNNSSSGSNSGGNNDTGSSNDVASSGVTFAESTDSFANVSRQSSAGSEQINETSSLTSHRKRKGKRKSKSKN